jgi:hypothetical protein
MNPFPPPDRAKRSETQEFAQASILATPRKMPRGHECSTIRTPTSLQKNLARGPLWKISPHGLKMIYLPHHTVFLIEVFAAPT